MQVTYNSGNFQDQIRCLTYSAYGRPSQVLMLVLPGIFVGVLALMSPHSGWSSTEAVGLVIGCGLMFPTLAFVMVLLAAAIRGAGPRICTTTLAPEGFIDVAPDSTSFVEWRRVGQIRNHNGDVFVWTSSAGSFIPRSAFKSVDAAEYFAEAARMAKRGDYSRLQPAAPAPPAYWPPHSPMTMPVYQQPQSGTWPPPPVPCPQQGPGYSPPPAQYGPYDPIKAAKRASKKQQIRTMQVMFIVPMFVIGFSHFGQPINPARAHAVAMLDLCVIVICLVGLAVTEVMAQRIR